VASKPNHNRIEDVDALSQLDYGGVIKDVHSFPGHYLRVRDALTVVKQHYDYLTATYNVNDLPTQIKYYVGLSHHETKVSIGSDVSGSLNNKYFFIFEGRSDRKFHVWYNVNGAGVDPAPSNSTGIEVAINTNDPSAIVAYATELILNSSSFSEYFEAKRSGSLLYITANKSGVATDSLDVDTGFTILNQQGVSQLVQTVDIEYDGTDPLFDGQVLKGYYYNIYSGAFEKGIDLDAAIDDGLSVAPTVLNIAAPLANTEYSFVLPANTNKFEIRSRDSKALVKFCYTLGASGTTYFTVNRGCAYRQESLRLTTITSRTIYFQTSSAANILEVIAWV